MTDAAPLPPLSAEGVRIEPSLSGDVLLVPISGTIGMRDPGELLGPYFGGLDAEAVRLGLKTVAVDVRGVGFMNSSGIAALARWVARLEARAAAASYRLV